jgi:FkbM family methyltransferase
MDFGLRRLLVQSAGNSLAQRALDWNVYVSQYLMGIGSGSSPVSSGEQAILALALRRVQGPLCIFDVGANRGQFVQLALRAVSGRAAMIHCFEPSHDAFAALRADAGTRPDVRLNNVALGSAPGSGTLFSDTPGSGLASLTRRRLEHHDVEFRFSEVVAIETLDDYCATQGVDRVDLLKLDVEGHELDVLRGAARMLGAGSIELVTFEFGGCNIDTRSYLRDFFDLFEGYRMRLARITPSGYLVDLPRYREAFEQFRTSNFLARKG